MKVAVFGSWRKPDTKQKDWVFTGSRSEFESACRQIGHELARRRCTLVVESQESKVADPHVVDGYVDFVRSVPSDLSAKSKIEVAYARGQEQPFEDVSKQHHGLIAYHQSIPAGQTGDRKWRNSHLVSLKQADAVLTIGGEQGTYLAGSTAIVAGKRLVPIASFAGASASLLQDLENEGNPIKNGDPSLLHALNGPWPTNVLDMAMHLLLEAHKAVFISHAHRDVRLARALVTAIEVAFGLPATAIRCTSVPGYALPTGTHVAGRLQLEVKTTEFVIGIVTPNSVNSKYVLFELGAAWGLDSTIFPLIACGARHSDLPGPVSELRSLDLARDQDCYQLLDDLGASSAMGVRNLAKKADVADAVGRIVELAGSDAHA